MEREQVLSIISDERNYQEKLAADLDRPDVHSDMTMGEILLAMKHNLDRAIISWYSRPYPYTEPMNFVRKVAALAVKAGETFEMPERNG